MSRALPAATAALLLATGLAAAPARADDTHPVAFQPATDAPLLAATGFAWLAGNLMQSTIISQPSCDPCRASDVNALDRDLAGRRDRTADLVSWGMVALLLAAPIAADAIDVAHSRASWRSFGDDVGVTLETLAINGALNEAVKLLARRPRPLVYDPALADEERAKPDNYASFWSEHSSTAFAAAAAYTTLFALRHSRRPGLIALVAAAGAGLALSTAALRVVAGKHFYSDVGTGALVGAGVGVLVPLLHRRPTARLLLPAVAPLPGGAMASWTITTR